MDAGQPLVDAGFALIIPGLRLPLESGQAHTMPVGQPDQFPRSCRIRKWQVPPHGYPLGTIDEEWVQAGSFAAAGIRLAGNAPDKT